MATNSISEPKLLLVEGTHEVSFFKRLLQHARITGIQPINVGGQTLFESGLNNLQTDERFPEVTSIGIVRDADNDFSAKLASIQAVLRRVGLPCPQKATVAEGDSPAVTLFIMPNNQSPGSLEDLCIAMVSGEEVFACVRSYLGCIEKVQGLTHPHHAKASVQVYLAGKPEGDIHMGIAAQKGYWDFDSPALEDLRRFLGSI